jgi:1-acyl-sn-glycerol-3-phosphate acyltransferase
VQARAGRLTGFPLDLGITLLLWGYYTAGFVLLFAPFYLAATLMARDTARSFQKLNCRFYRIFFKMVRALIPACRWDIAPNVNTIRSSVVVCNHISYLDPILLISLYERHTTIAKARLFNIPLYGKMLALSGYLPSAATGRLAELMLHRMETMAADLAAGGNLIIFPEGTRGRDGRIGRLNKGAFKIARLCRAPIKVLLIRNTDKLFKPGRFLFDTQRPNRISVELLADIDPDYDDRSASIDNLMQRVHTLLEQGCAAPTTDRQAGTCA